MTIPNYCPRCLVRVDRVGECDACAPKLRATNTKERLLGRHLPAWDSTLSPAQRELRKLVLAHPYDDCSFYAAQLDAVSRGKKPIAWRPEDALYRQVMEGHHRWCQLGKGSADCTCEHFGHTPPKAKASGGVVWGDLSATDFVEATRRALEHVGMEVPASPAKLPGLAPASSVPDRYAHINLSGAPTPPPPPDPCAFECVRCGAAGRYGNLTEGWRRDEKIVVICPLCFSAWAKVEPFGPSSDWREGGWAITREYWQANRHRLPPCRRDIERASGAELDAIGAKLGCVRHTPTWASQEIDMHFRARLLAALPT